MYLPYQELIKNINKFSTPKLIIYCLFTSSLLSYIDTENITFLSIKVCNPKFKKMKKKHLDRTWHGIQQHPMQVVVAESSELT